MATQATRQSTLKTILSQTRKKRPPFSVNTSRQFSLQSASTLFLTLGLLLHPSMGDINVIEPGVLKLHLTVKITKQQVSTT